MQIEPLNHDNIDHACRLASELHALGTFGHDGPPFDWTYTHGAFLHALEQPAKWCVLLAHSDGYVGIVFGAVTALLFSPRMFGAEEGWYVRPDTPRRAAIAMALMREFMSWCYGRGAIYVLCGEVNGSNSIGVDYLYRKLGFQRFGSLYRHVRVA